MAFLDDFAALRRSIPVPATRTINNENCEYMDYGGGNKHCAYCFVCFQLEHGLYCTFSGLGKYLVDCYTTAWSELCYECADCLYCYQSTYCFDCTKCRDCHFSSMCIDCSDCFGCVGLTHKQYCIFNKQYEPEKYKSEVAKLNQLPVNEILLRLEKLKKQTPHPQSHQRDTTNCPYGDYLSFSKNVYWGFNTYYLEDSGYFYAGGVASDCWDAYVVGGSNVTTDKDIFQGKCELCYECVGGGNLYNCAFLYQSSNNTNCFYGWDLRNCSDCFGCVGLTNKKYCILNNQLTKEQYEQGIAMIKRELGWKV